MIARGNYKGPMGAEKSPPTESWESENQSPKEKFIELWNPVNLPERFSEGQYAIYDDEKEILEGYIQDFYRTAEKNGYVNTVDCVRFVEFMYSMMKTGDDELMKIVADAMILNSQLGFKLDE